MKKLQSILCLAFLFFPLLISYGQYTPTDPMRFTVWNPGLNSVGGIPNRTTVYTTLSPSGGDDSKQIQDAINACPADQVVQLSAGIFIVNDYLLINKNISLRGAGAGLTILRKTNGAFLNEYHVDEYEPIVVIGPNRWPHPNSATSQDFTVDGEKGSTSVTVSNASAFSVGQIVLLDELSGASWQTDRQGRGQIYASPDYRVVWKLHNPAANGDDPLIALTPTPEHPESTGGEGTVWVCRQDRPTAEMKEIKNIVGNTITFSSPLHINYRVSHKAQLTAYYDVCVAYAGVENLTLNSGSEGCIRFEHAAYSWAKEVEVTLWLGHGVNFNGSFRCELRDSYIHDAAWASPGGGGYAIALETASSDILIENNISVRANKVMVANSAGAGSVYGYNYVDEGFINYMNTWIECGLNASHFVGSHHVLFEGNYGFNWDSDFTHGNSIYHTVFRNHIRGVRHSFINPYDGKVIDDITQNNGPQRCIGSMSYSNWMTFVGNILGEQGKMAGWNYEGTNFWNTPAIWWLGWDDIDPFPYDTAVLKNAIRDGNWDWLQSKQSWHNSSSVTLQNSLYLSSKPAFFGPNTWPWVDPTTGTVYTLPAKVRFDSTTLSESNLPNIVAISIGRHCGSGTVTLGATANKGTINWYANAVGGTSLGTGTSFTTPSISSKTMYYVDATYNGKTTPTRVAVAAIIDDPSDCQTGMISLTDNAIKIFPNPTNGMVEVLFKNEEEIKIELYDYQGRLIQSIAKRHIDNTFQFDFSKYPAGLYLMKFTTQKGISIERIIKNQ
jgi:hypothetical protein